MSLAGLNLCPMPSDYTDDLRLAHVLADDADSTSQARFKALDLHVMTKPDLTPVTDADQSVEEGIRRVLSRARPRDAVQGRSRARPGTASVAGWWTRSTAPRTSSAAYPSGPRLISLMVDDEVVVGVVLGADAEPALVGDEGRRRLDRQVAAARHAPARSPTSPAIEDASLSYSSLHGWDERGRLEDFMSLSRRCWRTRAYGDFWSYMLVAEGAVDIATEPRPLRLRHGRPRRDRARGRRRVHLARRRARPMGGSALATNGKLHDQALAFLGSHSDHADPHPGGTVHDLSARRGEPAADAD